MGLATMAPAGPAQTSAGLGDCKAPALQRQRYQLGLLRPPVHHRPVGVAVQVVKADQARLVESSSLPGGDFVKRVVKCAADDL